MGGHSICSFHLHCIAALVGLNGLYLKWKKIPLEVFFGSSSFLVVESFACCVALLKALWNIWLMAILLYPLLYNRFWNLLTNTWMVYLFENNVQIR